jgi:hypothetical protein
MEKKITKNGGVSPGVKFRTFKKKGYDGATILIKSM